MKRSAMMMVLGASGLGLTIIGCGELLGLPSGQPSSQCTTGALQCEGNQFAKRCVDGVWETEECTSNICIDGQCMDCVTGDTKCGDDNTVQACLLGEWEDKYMCVKSTCIGGGCTGICAPDEPARCVNGKTLQTCSNGDWVDSETCAYGCSGGVCLGICEPDSTRCNEQVLETCNAMGEWEFTVDCPSQNALCVMGKCIAAPTSCIGMANDCGPFGNESCCAASNISGGTFNRGNDPAYPATVADFSLDRFEVTVGRFRKFVDAYPGSMPADNAGAHPLIAESGWRTAWISNLPVDQADLRADLKCDGASWTDMLGANEHIAVNCLSWYLAFAFCAWDGGRLPTEAEWNYAAAAGSEQRPYPWGTTVPDPSYAVYECMADGSAPGACTNADKLPVGSRSMKGDGKFGQADLAGSVTEWTLDTYDTYPTPCENCANVADGAIRVIRGGAWNANVNSLGTTSRGSQSAYPINPADYDSIGVRCARNLQ